MPPSRTNNCYGVDGFGTSEAKSWVVQEDGVFRFLCPHCASLVEVRPRDVRCKIFRHATLKTTGEQIGPHTSKAQCDKFAADGLVYGCARPFYFHFAGSGQYVTKCGYI